MSETASLDRRGAMSGRRSVSIIPSEPMMRFSFRGNDAATTALASVFGVMPEHNACRASSAGDRSVLWLGPDEWMLMAPHGDTEAEFARLEQALATVPHSLVDISHRNTGFDVVGEGAEALLSEGCPLDLSLAVCPVGFSSRTVLGKSEIALWRKAPDSFRLECWRSFAPYVSGFLTQSVEGL